MGWTRALGRESAPTTVHHQATSCRFGASCKSRILCAPRPRLAGVDCARLAPICRVARDGSFYGLPRATSTEGQVIALTSPTRHRNAVSHEPGTSTAGQFSIGVTAVRGARRKGAGRTLGEHQSASRAVDDVILHLGDVWATSNIVSDPIRNLAASTLKADRTAYARTVGWQTRSSRQRPSPPCSHAPPVMTRALPFTIWDCDPVALWCILKAPQILGADFVP